MNADLYTLDWDEHEELDRTSIHDYSARITAVHTEGRLVYDIEATGTFSCGELVEITDAEVTGVEAIDAYDVYGG